MRNGRELADLRRSAKVAGTAFLGFGGAFALIAHFVTDQPMAWWPDTAIMGGFAGLLAALGTWQHRRSNRFIWDAVRTAFHRRA